LTAAQGQPSEALEILVALLSLGTMIGLSIWTRGALKMFSALVGMVVGYVAAGVLGVLDAGALGRVTAAPLISAPSLGHLGWSLDATFMIPFALGALAACLKTVGCVTTCQKINDADWVRPDMRSAGRGVMADAVGTIGAGLLGTIGMNSSPTSVGVSGATGVTSRRVAYAIAAIFLALAFMPKAAATLAVMPRPVIGAALLFAACFVIINGQEIIASRLLDVRRTFVIGLSFMVGLAVELVPAYFSSLPPNYQPVLGSSLVLGMLCALFLNLVFRLGTWRTGQLRLELDRLDPARVAEFMEAQGAAWGARRDVIERARFSLAQAIETIVEGCAPQGPLDIETTFDEFNVDVRVSYPGAPLELPEQRPTNEEIMQSEEGQRRLAGFMLRRQADRVAATHRAGRSTILFHFDH
jgi:NCS2 family nucleobase:cation symporter-2